MQTSADRRSTWHGRCGRMAASSPDAYRLICPPPARWPRTDMQLEMEIEHTGGGDRGRGRGCHRRGRGRSDLLCAFRHSQLRRRSGPWTCFDSSCQRRMHRKDAETTSSKRADHAAGQPTYEPVGHVSVGAASLFGHAAGRHSDARVRIDANPVQLRSGLHHYCGPRLGAGVRASSRSLPGRSD